MLRLTPFIIVAVVVALGAAPAVARPVAKTPAKAGKAHAAAKAPRCQPKDELVPIKHGDGGGVWIPREVSCGGRAPVIIALHGNNGDRVSPVSVGGGRALDELARGLIKEHRIRPVILAEPVHFRACGSGLYNDGFDFRGYRAKLEKVLAARHIKVQSFSVTGHSGAGCCGGVYRAAEAFGPLRLLGLIDTCYGSTSYARAVREHFDGRGTIVLNASRGEPGYPHYRQFEHDVLGGRPLAVGCNADVYRRCLKSPHHPYFSFTTTRTEGSYHGEIPSDYYRTMLVRFFPAARPLGPRVAARTPAPARDSDRPRSARTSH
ncbi:MAG TPA: hypothetical protein VGQ83_30390 [Polyangia bacterium]|jgi:hypothetical protein